MQSRQEDKCSGRKCSKAGGGGAGSLLLLVKWRVRYCLSLGRDIAHLGEGDDEGRAVDAGVHALEADIEPDIAALVEDRDHAIASTTVIRADDSIAHATMQSSELLIAENRDVAAKLEIDLGSRAIDNAAQLQ